LRRATASRSLRAAQREVRARDLRGEQHLHVAQVLVRRAGDGVARRHRAAHAAEDVELHDMRSPASHSSCSGSAPRAPGNEGLARPLARVPGARRHRRDEVVRCHRALGARAAEAGRAALRTSGFAPSASCSSRVSVVSRSASLNAAGEGAAAAVARGGPAGASRAGCWAAAVAAAATSERRPRGPRERGEDLSCGRASQ
jgi:hypothetical protein